MIITPSRISALRWDRRLPGHWATNREFGATVMLMCRSTKHSAGVVVDFSGRPMLTYNAEYPRARIGGFDVDLLGEFFPGFLQPWPC